MTRCEAEHHVPSCECLHCRGKNCNQCRNITQDHFTPKSIARRVLGWRPKEINSKENIQWLSTSCHREKDRTTPDRLIALIDQKRGGNITMDDVKYWAEQNEF
jgi:hypothetical protein